MNKMGYQNEMRPERLLEKYVVGEIYVCSSVRLIEPSDDYLGRSLTFHWPMSALMLAG